MMQMLFHITSFRKAVYQLPPANDAIASSVTLALQSVFSDLQVWQLVYSAVWRIIL
jgi:hypothetical protein